MVEPLDSSTDPVRPSHPRSGARTSRAGPARCRCATARTIVMGHGGGGAMSAELVEHVFLPALRRRACSAQLGDSAVLDARRCPDRVLHRLVRGAAAVLPRREHRRPRGQRHRQRPGDERRPAGCTSRRRSSSRRAPTSPWSAPSPQRLGAAAREAGVEVVTGDTKVVESGHGDGVYVNTAGIGLVPDGRATSGRTAPRPGDVVIVSGDIGVHGVAIMSVREGLEFGTEIRSDCAAAGRPGRGDARGHPGPARAARPDPRRAGARRSTRSRAPPASASSSTSGRIPVPGDGRRTPAPSSASTRCTSPTRASSWPSCRREQADAVLAAMRAHPYGADAAVIGECVDGAPRHGGRRGPASAPPGWSTCRSASSCRGSAEAMKFLVLWQIELALLSEAMVRAIARMPEYGTRPRAPAAR